MAYSNKSVGDRGTASSFGVVPPSGNAANHIALLVFGCESDATVQPPSGFAIKYDIPGAPSSAESRLVVMWKRLASNETSPWAVTFAGGVSTWADLTAFTISGRATSGDPFGLSSAQSASGTGITLPSINAAADADLFYALNSFNDATWSTPAGMTEAHDAGGNTAFGYQNAVPAGATGSKSFTASSSGPIRGQMFTLLPAAAPVLSGGYQLGSVGY